MVLNSSKYFFRVDKSWPAIVIIVSWILCILCILGGALMVFAFGVTFGNSKTYQWMTSMITSVFSSILITQPLKVLIMIGFISFCCKIKPFDDDHVDLDEDEPTIYYDPDDPTLGKT